MQGLIKNFKKTAQARIRGPKHYKDKLVLFIQHNLFAFAATALILIICYYSNDIDFRTKDIYFRDIVHFINSDISIRRGIIWGAPSFFLFLSFLVQEKFLTKFRNFFMVKIGDASYSLSLFQVIPVAIKLFIVDHIIAVQYWRHIGFSLNFYGGLFFTNSRQP